MNFFKRKQKVLKQCGNVCYCPKCKDILNDQAECIPDVKEPGMYYYYCMCGNVSQWHFGIAPVPIMLKSFITFKTYEEYKDIQKNKK